MFIILIIFLLLVFLFISKKLIKLFFQDNNDKIIEKLTLSYEEHLEKIDNIFNNWIKSLYDNELISLLLPKDEKNILVLCSFTNKKDENKILAIPINTLKEFLYNKSSLIICLKESPRKNLYLSSKINSNIFDISLKVPYFFDKENVYIIEDVNILEELFF